MDMEPSHKMKTEEVAEKKMPVVVAVLCMLLLSLAGAGLLVWWTLRFHPSNTQLWMVPVGLVLTGTPAMVSFTFFTLAVWQRVELMLQSRSDGHLAEAQVHDLERQ